MTFSLANPLPEFVAGMLLPGCVLYFFVRRRVRDCAHELGSCSVARLPILLLRRFGWHLCAAALSICLVWTLIVGSHRLFVRVSVDSAGLLLSYPWPRSNVRLVWPEVSQAVVESRPFGIFEATRFRLRVESADSVFCSPWSASAKDLNLACDAIQSHLKERKL